MIDSDLFGMPPSSKREMDRALDVLQSNKGKWVRLDIDRRIAILEEIIRDMQRVEEQWVTTSMRAKGTERNSFGEGEEWFFLAFIYRLVRVLRNSLFDIKKFGRPKIPGGLSTRADGQVVAHVFPQSLRDRLLLINTSAQVWMEPGVSADEVIQGQASFYHDPGGAGKVSLVLGAGNAPFLVPGDFLYKLFVEGQVVALKLNPVNEYLGPIIEKGFRALVSPGFMQILYGGAEEGAYLSYHPAVDELHMTGSHHTFEAIVFGPGEQGAKRKAAREPQLLRRFTAELGNITPVIVVPGDWSEADVLAQALKIASWLVFNAGFACPAPRLIVQSRNWPLRDALNKAIGEAFSSINTRKAYYPGAHAIHQQFISAHPEAKQYGESEGGHLPWTYITDVDPKNTNDICFKSEPFCSLFSETSIEADSVPDFLNHAVAFLNDEVWGTLAASIVVHPKSLKDPQVRESFDRAVANLRYGTVAINQYAAISYFTGVTTWGGFPGQDIYDIQSGTGFTNNFLMFAHPQKSVLRCPFTIPFDPYSATNQRAHIFGKRVAEMEAYPSMWKLARTYWSVLRSQVPKQVDAATVV